MTSESLGVTSLQRDRTCSRMLIWGGQRSRVHDGKHVRRNTVTLTTCHANVLVEGVSVVSWCDCWSSEEHECQEFFSVRPVDGTEAGPVHNIHGSDSIRVLGSRSLARFSTRFNTPELHHHEINRLTVHQTEFCQKWTGSGWILSELLCSDWLMIWTWWCYWSLCRLFFLCRRPFSQRSSTSQERELIWPYGWVLVLVLCSRLQHDVQRDSTNLIVCVCVCRTQRVRSGSMR